MRWLTVVFRVLTSDAETVENDSARDRKSDDGAASASASAVSIHDGTHKKRKKGKRKRKTAAADGSNNQEAEDETESGALTEASSMQLPVAV